VDAILDGSQPREAVMTDAALYFAGVHEDATGVETPRLVEMSLETGEITDHADLPRFGGTAGDDLDEANLMLAGDTLVAAVTRQTGADGHGYVAAYDLGEGIDAPAWVQETEDEPGPTRLTLGDGVVHANDGDGFVTAYALADGTPVWEDLDVIERGGGMNYEAVSDVDGRLFTLTRYDSGSDGRAVTAVSADGEIEWQAPRALIRQEAGLTEDDLPSDSLRMGPIGADGTLYVFRGGTIFAIDDSGGLDAACQLPFVDVDEDLNVHAANICRLVEAGITSGLTEDTYGPGEPVTRQQMAAFLTRALDLEPRPGGEFTDVDADNPHAENINAILDAGITSGYPDGTFDPAGELDRQQLATFLARAAGLEGVDGSGFDDVTQDNVHRENIYAVRDADITAGVSGSRFAPDRTVVRDQMASFLMRMVDHAAEEG
jgi:hypothetical protein